MFWKKVVLQKVIQKIKKKKIVKVLQKENVQYRFIDEELSHATFGIAFLKDSKTAVRDALSETLSEMLADGTTASILKRYGVDTAKALGGLSGE